METTPAVNHDAGAEDEEYDWDRRIFKYANVMSSVIRSLMFVRGVWTHSMVIWALGFRMRKTVGTVLFLNLAVAEVLGTVFLSLNITETALGNWPFGWFMCKFMDTMVLYVSMYVSIFIMVLIGVNTLSTMDVHHRTVINAYSQFCLGVWVCALAITSPHVNNRELELEFGFCYDYFPEPSLVITNLIVGFVFPAIVIFSCYFFILIRTSKHLSKRPPLKILKAVTAAYFLCFAPFHIIQLISVVVTPSISQVVFAIGAPISHALALLNSYLNPLLSVFTGGVRLSWFDGSDSVLKVLEKAFAEDEDDEPTKILPQARYFLMPPAAAAMVP